MIYRHILTSLFLFLLISLSTNAFPPSSPAGGNYLALDGVDDYAVLDFEAFDVLLPKGTDEFTVEAWVYPTTPPDKNTTAMILSQQVQMRVVSDKHNGYQGGAKTSLPLAVEAHGKLTTTWGQLKK